MTRAPLVVAALLGAAGCEPLPATPSDEILVPYQFILEFTVERDDAAEAFTARARLYDATQVWDVWGNQGTIELAGGDALFADDVELDIETRMELGNQTLRVDYSQAIPSGKDAYRFELRRPEDERIEASVAAPEPLAVEPLGDLPDYGLNTITWGPVIEGARVDILVEPVDPGCADNLVEFWPQTVASDLEDEGSYSQFRTSGYHSVDGDCAYELIVRRRVADSVRGTWHVQGQDLPAQDVWGLGETTSRTVFTALQR